MGIPCIGQKRVSTIAGSVHFLTAHLQHSFTSNEYARLGQMALQAMARPVLAPEIQTPTNAWAGLGFSRSMNAAEMTRYN